MRANVFVASAVFALCGCSSSAVMKAEAPDSATIEVTGSPMESAKLVDKARESGFGLDRQVLDNEGRPVTDEEVNRLLDWRVALPKNGRLALLEARAFREYYYCGSFGEPSRTVEGSEWAVRPATPEDVKSVRDDLMGSGRFESVT